VIREGPGKADLKGMRRAFALLAVLALGAVAAGCSGREAREAQTLLAQSNEAFAEVRSATFTIKMTLSGGPPELQLADSVLSMSGGGYSRGRRAGDFYVLLTSQTDSSNEVLVVSRSGRISMMLNGSPIGDFPAPLQDENPIELVAYGPYVKDVSVEHGKVIDGLSVVKISGALDTAALVDGVISDVTGSSVPGLDLSKMLGDTRVVLYVSETTHLPLRGLADMTFDVAGEKVALHMDFAYTSFNERVRFP
jgi:hypothetical protein